MMALLFASLLSCSGAVRFVVLLSIFMSIFPDGVCSVRRVNPWEISGNWQNITSNIGYKVAKFCALPLGLTSAGGELCKLFRFEKNI